MAHQFQVTLKSSQKRTVWSNATAATVAKKPKLLILLFHGFPDVSDGWLPVLSLLDKQFPGALILAPTMKGYEESSTNLPDSEYHLSKIAEEYILYTEFAQGSPVHVVGHDWGACAAYRAHHEYPKAFTSVTTLSIPWAMFNLASSLPKAPEQLWLSSYMLTMNLPFIYRPRIMQNTPNPYIKGLVDYWSPGYEMPAESFAKISDTLHIPGIMDSTTAYYRNLPKLFAAGKWQFAWDNVRLLGGRKDGCASAKLFEIDRKAHPNNVVILETVGHFMQYEDPELVAKEISAHISSY